MARIGDYIDAGLNRYDPGDFLRGSAITAASIGQSLQQGMDSLTSAIDDRREKKEDVQVAGARIKAAMELLGDRNGYLGGIEAALRDESLPLASRAAIGKESAALISAYMQKEGADRAYHLDLATTGANLAKAEREGRVFESNWQAGQAEKAAEEEINAQIAPYLVEQSVKIAEAMEGQGQQAPISSKSLLTILREGTPQEKRRASEMFAALLPKESVPEFKELPVTIDGQPGKAMGTFNPRTRQFDIVPVNGASATMPSSDFSANLPKPLAPYAQTFIEAGQAHGVDPKFLAAIAMHETANGTSSAFRDKRNAMGISDANGPTMQKSVEDSIHAMARSLTREGGHYDGKMTIPEIAGTYAPAKGATNDPRKLNQYWPGKVAEYYAGLGGDPSAPVKILPGAATTAGKTATEQEIDRARLAKLQGDVAGKASEMTKQTDMKASAITSARETLQLIDAIPKHPGFSAAVGAGLRKSLSGIWGVPNEPIAGSDEAGSVAQINKLQAGAFLTAIQQLRGLGALSDAEGKKLEAATANLDRSQNEADFKRALDQYRQSVQEVMARLGGDGGSSSTSAADRLRAMIPAQ